MKLRSVDNLKHLVKDVGEKTPGIIQRLALKFHKNRNVNLRVVNNLKHLVKDVSGKKSALFTNS